MNADLRDRLEKAGGILRKGGVVAYPTESSYAIGCLIDNIAGIKRIYGLKKREKGKPLPVIAFDEGMIGRYAVLGESEKALIHNLMPGRLTLILQKKKSVPDELSKEGIAVRIPGDEIARELCGIAGKPVVSTSANVSGEEAIYSGERVLKELGGKVDFVLDVGDLPKKKASTVFHVGLGKVLRNGPVSEREINKVLEKESVSLRKEIEGKEIV